MKLTQFTREMIFDLILELQDKIAISKKVAAKDAELATWEEIRQDLHRGEIARLKQALFTDEFEFQY
jgi:hypothetical protein